MNLDKAKAILCGISFISAESTTHSTFVNGKHKVIFSLFLFPEIKIPFVEKF